MMSTDAHHMLIDMILRVLVAASLIALGIMLLRAKPRKLIGLRTPWTLASARSWSKSNLAAGWILLAYGAIIAVLAAFRPVMLHVAILTSLPVAVILVIAFSYFVWRADPERSEVTPDGGTEDQPAEQDG